MKMHSLYHNKSLSSPTPVAGDGKREKNTGFNVNHEKLKDHISAFVCITSVTSIQYES